MADRAWGDLEVHTGDIHGISTTLSTFLPVMNDREKGAITFCNKILTTVTPKKSAMEILKGLALPVVVFYHNGIVSYMWVVMNNTHHVVKP